jgi:hypothetical protein
LVAASLLAGCATHSDGSAPSIKGPGPSAACWAAWSVVAWVPSRAPRAAGGGAWEPSPAG